jgi:hypothetical protein
VIEPIGTTNGCFGVGWIVSSIYFGCFMLVFQNRKDKYREVKNMFGYKDNDIK